MSEIYVIPQITLTEDGPAVTNTKPPQLIHLQQGDLDGACGPYCFCMALITLGIEKRSKLLDFKLTKSYKKLLKLISDRSGPLVIDGTELNAFPQYARPYEKMGLKIATIDADRHGNCKEAKEGKKDNSKKVREFIVEHVLRNARPVIIGNVDHYALVIGLGFEDDTFRKKENPRPRYLLLLDPDVPAPKHSAWNGVIEINVRSRKWYKWFGTDRCKIKHAIALWKE
jgi:hypothetical protein